MMSFASPIHDICQVLFTQHCEHSAESIGLYCSEFDRPLIVVHLYRSIAGGRRGVMLYRFMRDYGAWLHLTDSRDL